MASRRVKILDLFAGAGGLTRGFLDARGFQVVESVEADLYAAATYAANFGESHTFFGRISDYRDVPQADLVIGGPPCQGFSNLGKKDPADERNRLWRDFARVVVESDASMFVFENVARFSTTPEAALLAASTRKGRRLQGFGLQVLTLNAADYGVPQKRSRTFIVGSKIGPITVPPPTHARIPQGQQKPWVTLRDALQDRFPPEMRPEAFLPDSWSEFFDYLIPGPFKLNDIHVGRTYQAKSLERYALIPPGGNRFLLPEKLQYDCWKRHTSGATDVLGRLEWDEPSVTIRTEFFKPEKGRYLHPEWSRRGRKVNRALTHAEAAVIQGFDDRHVWTGAKVEIAKQIGNAVPPPLARAVARRVKERMSRG